MNVAELQPRRHEPPQGWPAEVFTAVTDALASVLIAAYRRKIGDEEHEAREAGR